MKSYTFNIRKVTAKLAKKLLPLISVVGVAVNLTGCSSSLTKSNQSSAYNSHEDNQLISKPFGYDRGDVTQEHPIFNTTIGYLS